MACVCMCVCVCVRVRVSGRVKNVQLDGSVMRDCGLGRVGVGAAGSCV